jgi:hypothetical protein
MIKNQEKFYKPDSLWEVYNINSKEEFCKKINLSPKFHKDVPEDIVNEFKTVQYLIVLSYHHAGFLDEAVTKALVAIEIAIKLKAKELQIPLEYQTKKNSKPRSKLLFKLIEEVLTKINLLFLKPDFDRARNIRNSRVHKGSHTFMGVVGYPIHNIRLFINLINQIFQEENQVKIINNKNKLISEFSEKYKEKPMVLEFNKTRILINNILSFKYIKFKDTELLMLLIEPVLTNTYKLLTENPSRKPLLITIKDFIVTGETVQGIDQNEKMVSVHLTSENDNMEVHKLFLKEKSRLSEINLQIYRLSILGDAFWDMEKIMFDNCW